MNIYDTAPKKAANTIRGIRPSILGVLIKSIMFPNRAPFTTENGVFFINPCEDFGNVLINHGIYEKRMSELIRHFSKTSSVFFDIGANEGYFSILAKLANPNLAVHAFEPQARLQPILAKNCDLNGIEIALHNIALSNDNTQSTMFLANSMNNGSSSINRKPSIFYAGQQKVTKKSMDSFLEENHIQKIDFAKIDIEGHEYQLLKGGVNTFKNLVIKNIVIEFHPAILTSEEINELQKFLLDCGYKKRVMFEVKYFSND